MEQTEFACADMGTSVADRENKPTATFDMSQGYGETSTPIYSSTIPACSATGNEHSSSILASELNHSTQTVPNKLSNTFLPPTQGPTQLGPNPALFPAPKFMPRSVLISDPTFSNTTASIPKTATSIAASSTAAITNASNPPEPIPSLVQSIDVTPTTTAASQEISTVSGLTQVVLSTHGSSSQDPLTEAQKTITAKPLKEEDVNPSEEVAAKKNTKTKSSTNHNKSKRRNRAVRAQENVGQCC